MKMNPPIALADIVKKYLEVAGEFGGAVALGDFGLDPAETENIFGTFDEDYHISRYFHFSKSTGTAYRINGFKHTHVTIDSEIQTIL